jgi:integrase
MQRGKIFRKGSSWHLRYKAHKYVDGKKIWWTTSTKLADIDLQHRTQESVEDDAEKFLKSINPVKRPGVLAKGVPTFEEQSKIWLDRSKDRVKTKTLRNWKSHLKVHVLPTLGNYLLSDVTNKAVKEFVAQLPKLSANSVRNVVNVIKLVKASAINDEGDEIYPTKWNHEFISMPPIKERELRRPAFSAEQIEAMIDKADRRLQMLVILLAATGIRAGEAFGLEVRHFDGSALRIEQAVLDSRVQTPKTENSYRFVELHPGVAKILKSYIGDRTQGFLFPNGGQKAIHQSDLLRRNFHPLLAEAKIPKNGFHGFRRYRNTYLRNETECPAGLLKYWLGHSASRDMSDRYDMVRDDSDFRRTQAKILGVGFKLPAQLKRVAPKKNKNVVRLVVRDSEPVSQ